MLLSLLPWRAPLWGWACHGAVPWSRPASARRSRPPLSAGAGPKPPVSPLFEPGRAQPVCRGPSGHVPFAELFHALVGHLPAAHERDQPLLCLSPVLGGQSLHSRRWVPGAALLPATQQDTLLKPDACSRGDPARSPDGLEKVWSRKSV